MTKQSPTLPARPEVVELFGISNPKDLYEDCLLLWVPKPIFDNEGRKLITFFGMCTFIFDIMKVSLVLEEIPFYNGMLIRMRYLVQNKKGMERCRREILSILENLYFSSVNFKLRLLSRRKIADLFSESKNMQGVRTVS